MTHQTTTTHPAAQIDAQVALDAVLALPLRGYGAHEGFSDVTKAALTYAAHTMAPAIGVLATLAKDHPLQVLQGENGWKLFFHAHEDPHWYDLLLVQDGTPGAFLVSVRYSPSFTPSAHEAYRALNATIEAAYTAAGQSYLNFVIDSARGNTTAAHAEFEAQKAIKADPLSYEPICASTKVAEVCVVALTIDGTTITADTLAGHHPGLRRDLTQSATATLWPVDHSDAYKPGLCCTMRPSLMEDFDHESGFMPHGTDARTMPGLPLAGLSAVLRHQGLTHLVQEANARMGQVVWWSSNVGNSVVHEEAGHALICANGGFYDANVHALLCGLCHQRASQNWAEEHAGMLATARRLLALGYDRPDHRFEANDGRDEAWVSRANSSLVVHNTTQDGTCTVTFGQEPSGEASIVVAQADGTEIGRFTNATTTRCTPSHDPLRQAIGPMGALSRTFHSLTSIACCLEEDHPITTSLHDA